MEKKSPYDRAPMRMKCVATSNRRVATNYVFGDTVDATWAITEMRALTDGKNVYAICLSEACANKILMNQTYMFKRLVLRGSRAYFNDDTLAFKSFNMEVPPEVLVEAQALLCPPSREIDKYEEFKEAQGYLTIKGTNYITDVRQVSLKGTPLPIRDVEVSVAGHAIPVTLWREVSLVAVQQGDWVTISHLRPTTHATFGFKLNSSVYTEVHQIEAAASERDVTIMAVSAGVQFYTVLLSCGAELKVPTQAWVGTEDQFLARLPLTVSIDVQGDLIVSTEKLFETDEQEEDIEGIDFEELLGC